MPIGMGRPCLIAAKREFEEAFFPAHLFPLPFSIPSFSLRSFVPLPLSLSTQPLSLSTQYPALTLSSCSPLPCRRACNLDTHPATPRNLSLSTQQSHPGQLPPKPRRPSKLLFSRSGRATPAPKRLPP